MVMTVAGAAVMSYLMMTSPAEVKTVFFPLQMEAAYAVYFSIAIGFTIHASLLVGVVMRKRVLYLPWIISTFPVIVFTVVECFYFLYLAFFGKDDEKNSGLYWFFITAAMIGINYTAPRLNGPRLNGHPA